MKLNYKEKQIGYQDAFQLYRQLTEDAGIPALLMESRTVNLAYGRQSIIAANPMLRIVGKNGGFGIYACSPAGEDILLHEFSKNDFPITETAVARIDGIEGRVEREFNPEQVEEDRVKNVGMSRFLRALMGKFQSGNKYAGLYGAFAYDFARNFEDIGNRHEMEPGQDFVLFLPADIYVFDDIRQTAVHYSLRGMAGKTFLGDTPLVINPDSNARYESMAEEEFMQKVSSIKSDINNGRFMQCVLSRSISMPLKEHPIRTYNRLRDINPSPYNYFFNFGGGEFLYGSSPEIHAVVEDGVMKIRPLAGTRRRSQNPLEDARARISLQTDPKELSEHVMLVDLARNEVYRLCLPESVRVTDVFTVEQYPNLYHLASGVEGRLREGFDSIDVLLTTIPAGTLSGAPKLEAMRAIEELETARRGFYGGAVGYLTFNGGCNTGIMIRSVNVCNNLSTVQAGAGIVRDSIPESEFRETNLKLEKLVQALRGG
ncbi:anthranilate synthase component I family protein [Candidatus Woesearchaeota archaeon]|nr:anthranilate synthase component I family protein [Candidatus Woesearchaeota archaeon]